MKTKSVDTRGWEGWEGEGHKQEEERDPLPLPLPRKLGCLLSSSLPK